MWLHRQWSALSSQPYLLFIPLLLWLYGYCVMTCFVSKCLWSGVWNGVHPLHWRWFTVRLMFSSLKPFLSLCEIWEEEFSFWFNFHFNFHTQSTCVWEPYWPSRVSQITCISRVTGLLFFFPPGKNHVMFFNVGMLWHLNAVCWPLRWSGTSSSVWLEAALFLGSGVFPGMVMGQRVIPDHIYGLPKPLAISRLMALVVCDFRPTDMALLWSTRNDCHGWRAIRSVSSSRCVSRGHEQAETSFNK